MVGKLRNVCRDCGEEKGHSTTFCHKCFRYTENHYIEEPVEDMSLFRTPKPEYPLRLVESYTSQCSRERKTTFISWPDPVTENFCAKDIDIEKAKQKIAKIDPELRKSIDNAIKLEQERELKITREMNTLYKKHRDMFEKNIDSIIESIILSINSVYPSVRFDFRGVSTAVDYCFKFTFFITFPKYQLNEEEFETFISKKGYCVEDQIHVLMPEQVMNPKVDGISNLKSKKDYTQYIIIFECPATAYNHLVKE